jgi:2-(1,2-epoxy-1,2-dihydrophenyl)acetyl-CoA isomerase
VKLGVFPALGGTVWIPRRVGYARALELMMTGAEIDAATARDWSFVNRIVAPGQAAAEAMRLARQMAQGPREAVRLIKQSLRDNFNLDETAALDGALERAIALGRSPEATEGLRAFRAREKPDFAAARARRD